MTPSGFRFRLPPKRSAPHAETTAPAGALTRAQGRMT